MPNSNHTVTANYVPTPLLAPSGLSSFAASFDRVDLSWTDNSTDETAFHIERSMNGDSLWQEVGTVGPNITSYQDTGLECETTYYHRVRAYRAGDDKYTDYSNVISVTTGTCPPVAAPSDLDAEPVGANQIDLLWTDQAVDESYFAIERSPNGIGLWEEIGSAGANASGYSDTTAYCGRANYYRVRAYRADDNTYSDFTDVVSATTPACLGSIFVTPESPIETQPFTVTVTGVAGSPCNVPYYNGHQVEGRSITIYLQPSSSGDVCAAVETPYSIDVPMDPLPAGAYQVWVYELDALQGTKAFDIYLDGGISLQATAFSDTEIGLSWIAGSMDATTYHVERLLLDGDTWAEIATLPAGTTIYTDTKLLCGRTYSYRVRAYRAGDGLYYGYSNYSSARTVRCPVPLPFSDDFTTDQMWINDTSGHFVWDTDNEWLSWHIHRSTDEIYYLPIVPYRGDVRFEARVNAINWSSNCDLYFGLADTLGDPQSGSTRPTGVFVDVGWFGAGVGNHLNPLITYSDSTERVGWNATDPSTYLTYNLNTWYRIVFETSGTNYVITLYDDTGNQSGQLTGMLPATHDPYKYIVLFNPYDGDWPEGNGLFDDLIVQPTGPTLSWVSATNDSPTALGTSTTLFTVISPLKYRARMPAVSTRRRSPRSPSARNTL